MDEDLNRIQSLMGCHTVTGQDVEQACVRNDCRTVTPIWYALKFVHGFDLQSFTVELVDTLLNQPYRGIMLRELNRFFAETPGLLDFHSLLAAAVEKQGKQRTLAPLCSSILTLDYVFAFKPSVVRKFPRSSGSTASKTSVSSATTSHLSVQCSATASYSRT